MDKFELQKLRDLPIEGVAERLGLEVKMHKALCPFHDDHHASLSFKVSRNTFRCFVCGESGGTIDLVMKVLGKDFKEATRWLADENCIILTEYKPPISNLKPQTSFDASRYERFFERPWLSQEARKFLFEERKLDERVVRWCRLTSWQDKKGVNWLQIPYYNQEGKLMGIQNRNLGFKKFKVQKFKRGKTFKKLTTVLLNLKSQTSNLKPLRLVSVFRRVRNAASTTCLS